MAVPSTEVGPLGGMTIWFMIVLLVVGIVLAPTLGAIVVWGIAVILVGFLLFILTRRMLFRLTGRRPPRGGGDS